jgi:hypothetical protein
VDTESDGHVLRVLDLSVAPNLSCLNDNRRECGESFESSMGECVPSKVIIFGWRLLLERLPAHMTLSRKGIIFNQYSTGMVLCILF